MRWQLGNWRKKEFKKKNQLNGFPKLKSKREVAEDHKHVEYKRERKSKI